MYPILPDCICGNRIRLTRIFRLSIIRYSFIFERQTVGGSRLSRIDTAVLGSALDKAAEPVARDPARPLFVFFVRRFVRRGRRVGIGARRPGDRLVGSRLWRMLSNVHVLVAASNPRARKLEPSGCSRGLLERVAAGSIACRNGRPFLQALMGKSTNSMRVRAANN
jgi:hypothetical protein